MARDSGGIGGVVKIGLVGVAGWFGYNYLVNSGLWGQWFGGAPSAGSSQLPTPPAPAAPAPAAPAAPAPAPAAPPLAPTATTPVSRAALIAAAGGPGILLDVDQWVYYYNQQKPPTLQVTGAQVNTLLNATGGSATNRAAQITVDQFLAVLPTAGLSGLGAPVRRPILARAAWGAKTPARALPPNYVRRGAPMIRRR